MRRRRHRAMTTLALITSIIHSGTAWALSWDAGLGNWSGSLGLDFAAATQTTQSPDGQGSTSSNRLFRESLSIFNNGYYIVDRRLFTGNLGLELGLDQTNGRSGETSATSRDRLVGYSFDSTFLAEKPYTASLFAQRNQSQSLQRFGGRREGTIESRGANFHLRQDSVLNDWGFPWFESNLDLRSSHNKSKTSIFGQSLDIDETSKTLQFNASKGFQNGDLALDYQINDHRNLAFTQGNFQSKAADLIYSVDFGTNLNRRFDASLSRRTRNGSAPSTTTSTSERLHVDHYQNLTTDYFYGLTRLDASGIDSTRQNAGFSAAHNLYHNLSTTAAVSGSRASLSNGSIAAYGGQLGQAYRHSLPGNGNVSANWSGGYQLSSNNLSAASVNIVDEAHNAPSPFDVSERGFLLTQSFAVVTSIVVVNLRGGGRTPVNAGDYEVITEGSQIRIVPRVGSLLIAAGDPLAVSYTYQVDQSVKYAAKSTGFGMGVDYHWIAIAFSHQKTEQTPLSGTTGLFLENRSQSNVQLSLKGSLLEMPANARVDFDKYNSTTTVYDRRQFSSALLWNLASNLKMNFGLNASDTQYTLPAQRKNASLAARTSLDWYASGGWINSASFDWNRYSDSGAPPQTLMHADLRASLTAGQLSLITILNFSDSLQNGTRSTDRGFNINAVRQF